MCKSLGILRVPKSHILFTRSKTLISSLGLRHVNNCLGNVSWCQFESFTNTLALPTLCENSATMGSSEQLRKTLDNESY